MLIWWHKPQAAEYYVRKRHSFCSVDWPTYIIFWNGMHPNKYTFLEQAVWIRKHVKWIKRLKGSTYTPSLMFYCCRHHNNKTYLGGGKESMAFKWERREVTSNFSELYIYRNCLRWAERDNFIANWNTSMLQRVRDVILWYRKDRD